MQSLRRPRYTVEEYLALEAVSKTRHEFINGEIISRDEILDMAGGSWNHNQICMNLAVTLARLLQGKPCFVTNSDQRVAVAETGLFAYPDVAVICGKPNFHAEDTNAVTNPLVIVEVMSPSTEQFDRGPKSAHYRQLASLKEYLLISQDEQRVELWRRLDNGQWLVTDYRSGAVESQALGGTIALADIYDRIELSSGLANGRALG